VGPKGEKHESRERKASYPEDPQRKVIHGGVARDI